MFKGLIILLLLTININVMAAAPFTVCKSEYALCTTAKCVPIPGKKGWVSCTCEVMTGFSAGTKPCEAVHDTKNGKLIYSRYYPIKSYVKCSNNRPWAWCLDSPCIIDKNDSSKAQCLCSLVQGKGDYIIVADSYSKDLCTSATYSSATLKGANQLTDFLKGQIELQPFPTRIIEPK